MKVSSQIIKSLQPCSGRFDNYLKHYSDFDGQIEDFISLDKITYSDKVWVSIRLMTRDQCSRWAALCALSVVHIFEFKFPGDLRPRKAIEAVLEGKSPEEIRTAAYDAYDAVCVACTACTAAYDAYDAYAAARAADAAANVAYTTYAIDAAYNASYAAAHAASRAAAYAARKKQENKNLQLIIDVVRGVK